MQWVTPSGRRRGKNVMYLGNDIVDSIKNSVGIVRLIADYVPLKKRGRNHLALCPFHSEKTPSFNVNEQKQIFHCFGCGVGGDIFKFISLMEHITFPEAIRFVANRYGIPLPAGDQAKSPGAEEKDELLKILQAATQYFHNLLLRETEGRGGLEFLRKRGIADETIERFLLGFASAAGDRLFRHLRAQGFTAETIVQSGIARKSDYDSSHFDYFRGRVIFPIYDTNGKVIAFGGRTLGEAGPKYLNSPDTLVYNKGRHLFGLHAAKDALRSSKFAILVEGYMDFIVPYQYGIRNIVASLGTGLTEQQVKLLGRYTRSVVVNYDSDIAGVNAAKRSVEIFLGEGFRVNVMVLPEGEDPDSYIQSAGKEKYAEELRASVPYLEFITDIAVRAERDFNSARAKINILNSVLPYLAKVSNTIERSEYASKLAERIGLEDQVIRAELQKAVRGRQPKIEPTKLAPRLGAKLAEARLLRTLLESPALRPAIFAQMQMEDFAGLLTERIFRTVQDLYLRGEEIDHAHLEKLLGDEDLKLLRDVYFREGIIATTAEEWFSDLGALRRLRLEASMRAIQNRMVEAEREQDDETLLRCYQEKKAITQKLYELYQI